jgi:ketosteroid isomerase-like protein
VNPNQRLVRRFHAAQGSLYGCETGVEAVGALLTGDVAWHVPGRNPIAGDYRGKPRVLDYFARRRDRVRGSLRIGVHRVLTDDEYVIQLAGGRAQIRGTVREWETVGVLRIADGRIAEGWLLPFDQYAFDAIWS